MQFLKSLQLLILMETLIIGLSVGIGVSANSNQVYTKADSQKNISYYTKIKPSSNYPIYQSGPEKTSSDTTKAVANSHQYNQYNGRKIHVTKQAVVQKTTWIKFSYQHFTGWVNQKATDVNYRWLNVPLIAQRPELPTGCEIVATTMMLNFAGAKVTKMQLAKQTPRSRNPNKGFVGSPYSPTGWYIYPKGLLKVVKKYAGSAQNLTGASPAKIKAKINVGHPVVVWVYNVDGFVNHALTVSGYSKTRFYYNDPWTDKKTSMTITQMQQHRSRDGYRALSY
ncbi:hypothetical protein YK48G_21920 [Lentilactobacillus fungorum]|uniref:GW domain-containing protein n=1 Tax=Lentilactobacillus fungorum TaxID=2201250 RepID=A0ABQ3W0R4_9LACO|nr:C39 family peptidase [Lentilactobacillus fungorum]GHP14767.1 hypothetical protein YK48G_21920 [Lentilactobacillus fungorum]